MSTAPTTLLALPNELLLLIFSHLSPIAPSIERFSHEPSNTLTKSTSTPLKAISTVSRRFRSLVLPLLFTYTRIPLSTTPQWVPIDARLLDSMQGHMSQLSDHEVQIYTRMQSKLKSTAALAFDEPMDQLLVNFCRVLPGDKFLNAVSNIVWLPHLPSSFAAFSEFVHAAGIKHNIKSVVVYTEKEYELRHVATADALLARIVTDFWSQVFAVVDPTRLVVAAPPTTMAGLLDTQMLGCEQWAFEMKMHYLELRQPDETARSHIAHRDSCRPWDSALIHRKPWTHLGYNEGSSVMAYSTYEYHLKQSPQMLYLLLLRLGKECQACCNIRSFSFTAVFPFGTNITSLVRVLSRISTLRKLHIQLAPGPENDMMDNPERMAKAQPRDLWLEWNECYKIIAVLLTLYDFTNGSEFVSGDCWGQLGVEAEEYVDQCVERGGDWRKTGSGQWIMGPSVSSAA